MTAATGDGRTRRPDRRDALLAGLAAVALLGLFVAVQWAKLPSFDGKVALSTARAMAEGRLHLLPEEDPTKHHFPYSHYGIGMPLLLLPLYLLQRALGIAPHLLESLASPLLLAASAALLYLAGRELGWSRRLALAGALVFGALTQTLQISQEAWSEPGVALGVALFVLGLLRWRAGRASGPWLAGSGLATGLLFRSDSMLLLGVGLLLLPAFVPWRRLLAERRAWVGLGVPILPVLAWIGWYSLLRDGTLVPEVYGGSFSTPLLTGLAGLLLSPGKSLFVYNPFLLLAVPGAVALWRRDWAATALLVALLVARVLLYARWSDWPGGVSWGPRFLMPAVGPLALLAVYAVSRIPRLHLGLRVPAAVAVVGLAVLAGVVNLASVWVSYGSSWQWVKAVPAERAARHHAYVWTFADSAIAYNLRHLDGDVRPFTLVHFSGGSDPIGIAALTVAALAALAAWLLAIPRLPPPTPARSPPFPHPSPHRTPGAVAQPTPEPEPQPGRAGTPGPQPGRAGTRGYVASPPVGERSPGRDGVPPAVHSPELATGRAPGGRRRRSGRRSVPR